MRWRPDTHRFPRDPETLLADVKHRAALLRRRRHVIRSGAVGAVALVGLGAIAFARWDTSSTEHVATRTAPTAVSSSLPATATSRPAAASASTAAPETTTTTPATTTTTLPCRDSFEPRCGPFYWDPDPGPSSPLTVTLSVEPANPRVGEQVTVTADVLDPDTPSFGGDAVSGDGGHLSAWKGGTLVCAAVRVPTRYGPWTPPARQPTSRQDVWHYTYRSPGTYTIRLVYTSVSCSVASQPYSGTGSAELTLTVSP